MPFPALPRVVIALCVVVAAASASAARAEELDDLRRENARLRSEVQSLQAQLDALRGGAANTAAIAPPVGSGSRMEPVYIPRTRVSLEVGRDEATGATTLATLWYRTADVGPLPRKEWLQLRADQMPDGTLRGPWMLVERQGAAGGGKIERGTLTVDGKPIELTVADYDVKRKNQTLGQITSSTRDERIRFALPASTLPLVAKARTVRLAAGSIDFQLTDEHLAAFSAMATRVAPAASAAE